LSPFSHSFPFNGLCPLKKFSGVGLDAEGGFLIIDCPCHLQGTAGLRA
jgi:hypothetical protein